MGCVYCSECKTDSASTGSIVVDFMKEIGTHERVLVMNLKKKCFRTNCSYRLLFVAPFKKRDVLASSQNIL